MTIHWNRLFFTLPFVVLGMTPLDAQEVTPQEAEVNMAEAAEASRLSYANMSFEEFRDSIPYFPQAGRWIVDGDIPITSEKQLREFFAKNVTVAPPKVAAGDVTELILSSNGGLDHKWSNTRKRQLFYCVSTQFGADYNKVVVGMQAATAAWEAVADVNFIHLSAEDGRCTSSNSALVFDVNPFNYGGQYLATAFFPNASRHSRSVLIDASALNLPANDALTLTGVLRHEIGHTLGFRHEHIRPDSGACFNSENWREVTDYDPFSVMHYPHCNGQGSWELRLSKADKSGSACIYGAAPGFAIDSSICTPLSSGLAQAPVVLGPVVVAEGAFTRFGPFDVTPGLPFEVAMTGDGDGDLYVKFDKPAGQNNYDCRPYLDGSAETCSVDVPGGAEVASVMVFGYQAAEVSLTITGTSAPAPTEDSQ